ncbi:hypothetical protein OBBRIDRAFT_834281 [Obba rivulosa]|uniref:Uncharacterized protein n=1 Tax=Obba rivulosa TaxID=1052685 RepID=A0A8E2DMQ3_9APHY|nr:hypothetical protein OBBRIDRAFT_834281 [Obba rivulosa]
MARGFSKAIWYGILLVHRAADAQNHIFDSLGERYGLRIIPGSNSFLVLPNNISRSTAVGAILHPGENATDFDFVLAIGKDEKLMRRLNELDNAETVSTGTRRADAKWTLDAKDVLPTLWRFTEGN